MHNYYKIVLAAVSLLLVAGCASHENFAKHYDTWIGKNIHYFTASYGYPDTSYKLPNGHEVYVYEKTRIDSYPQVVPTFGYGWGGYYGGMMATYGTDIDYKTCKLFLEVNKKGNIVQWGSRGNNCVM